MTRNRAPKAASDSELLGSRLRQARLNRGFSLQDVESLTNGLIKAATLSAYELGDTNIPALRLASLAELYDASVEDLLTSSAGDGTSAASEDPVHAVGALVRIDLSELKKARGPEVQMLIHLIDSIRERRSASSGRYFAMRSDDLIAAAAVIDRDLDDVLADLQAAGVLRRPRGRPLGRSK